MADVQFEISPTLTPRPDHLDSRLRTTFLNAIEDTVARITGATEVELGKVIQTLWSGYGVIRCASLYGGNHAHDGCPLDVVIKHIDVSSARTNSRGWGTDKSHQRKVRSYQVETRFYGSYSHRCAPSCAVPRFIAAEEDPGKGWVLVMADLAAAGFNRRVSDVDQRDINACLNWLANFHATFLNEKANGLWPVGTYWHLDTRPDEHASMPDGPLKRSAAAIDQRLNKAHFQTLVHGDAKVANFCFSSSEPDRVAAVDFQYTGRGCGMKDVAYFISSCLTDAQATAQQEPLLNFYFDRLRLALENRGIDIDYQALETEWRRLYPFAWADFCRFLSGWSPGHWKLNGYTDRITQCVLDGIAKD